MMTNKIESCGTRIKKALSLRGMTQAELCRLGGLPKNSVSAYTKDAYEPKEDRLHVMARVLNVDPLWLLGYDVSMDGKKNTPAESELDEGKRLWLEMYDRVGEDSRYLFVTLIDAFDSLPEEERKMRLAAIRLLLKK